MTISPLFTVLNLKFFFLCFQLFLLTSTTTLLAQEPVYVQYTVEDGLPSNVVYYTLQDSEGYLWIATDKGVVRFDGLRFEVFTTADGLADNECFDIYEDHRHRIWFASYNGEPSFYHKGKFHNQKNTAFLSEIKFSGSALKIMENGKGDLFYLTYSGIYRLRAGHFALIQTGDYYSALVADENKKVYALASQEGELVIIDLQTGKKTIFPGYKYLMQINSKMTFLKGKLITHSFNKVLVADLKTKKITQNEYTPKDAIIQFLTGLDGKLWIGTNHGFSSSKSPHKKLPFANKSISSISKDREHNFWISTLNEGLYLIINPNVQCFNVNTGLGFNNCFSINPLDQNVLGIGSDDFLFTLLKNDKSQSFQLPKRFGNGVVKRIRKINDRYFIATGSSFIELDAHFNLKNDILSTSKDFYIDGSEIYLVGGNSILHLKLSELLNPELSQDIWKNAKKIQLKAQGLTLLQNNKLCVYGQFGVYEWRQKQLIPLHSSEWLSKNVMDVYLDDQGITWIASSIYGLLALHKGKIFRFGQKSNLKSHYITSICAGKKNQLWIGSNQGLYKIDYQIKGEKIIVSGKNYNRSHGIASPNVNDVYYRSDTLWVATSKGLCVVPSSLLLLNKKRPVIHITDFQTNDSRLNLTDTLFLEPDSKRIKVVFNGISYFSLGKISYKYRLKGLQNTWNYTASNQLEYPSLSSGNYQLQVAAIDASGNASPVKNLWIQLPPHFYETWWFISILLILLSYLTLRFINHRFQKIKLNHALKQQVLQLEHDKLKIEHNETKLLKEYYELEQKALLLQMNPHFIFNSINSIQGLYKNEKEKADEYLIKFSNLLRQILEFSKSKIIDLEQEIVFLQAYMDINKLRIEKGFEYEIFLPDNLQVNNVGISPMILQPFVENALIHGIQPLGEGGKIEVHFRIAGELLICEITDNGIGREKAAALNKFRFHKSLGLEITQKRLNLFNKDQQNESLQFIDLYDKNGVACGTKVIIAMIYEEL